MQHGGGPSRGRLRYLEVMLYVRCVSDTPARGLTRIGTEGRHPAVFIRVSPCLAQ